MPSAIYGGRGGEKWVALCRDERIRREKGKEVHKEGRRGLSWMTRFLYLMFVQTNNCQKERGKELHKEGRRGKRFCAKQPEKKSNCTEAHP
ncbi:unnamed protein product [Victoria cruziana]